MRPFFSLTLAVTLVAGAACTHRSSLERLTAATPQEFTGHLTVDASGNWFRPCTYTGADSLWWVTSTGASVEQIATAKRVGQLVEGQPSFARLLAVPTTGGEIGPLGKGHTALLLREVIKLRGVRASDCGMP